MLVAARTKVTNQYMEDEPVGDCVVDGKDGPSVKSAEEMIGRFTSELVSLMPDWRDRLAAAPEQLEALEREVHKAFSRGADLLVVGLIAVVMKEAQFQKSVEQTRKGYSQPLGRGREKSIQVKLLGGLVMWVCSVCCPPRKKLYRGADQTGSSLYVELAQFGFGKGVSPGLESRVARKSALCPSFKLAHAELNRDGVKLDIKSVRRITYQCGEGMLHLRKQLLMQLREGTLLAGDEFSGKRISVQIDGGRTKLRGELRPAKQSTERTDADDQSATDPPGRSKKQPDKTYDTDWREPKLVTIFEHDENGKMKKGTKATIDGTFMGPDAICEIVALHLHRLGAAQAVSVTFVSDGAIWIWDRIDQIVAMANLQDVQIYKVLDCCHAVHHVSLAVGKLGLEKGARSVLYREYRSLLRNGHWRRVVAELSDLCGNLPETTKEEKKVHQELKTEIAYLQKHGEAGHMSYAHYRGLGIPLGSGAVESGIRRVINLRLKSNAMFWRECHAESMLQIRSQVISDRWDDQLQELVTLRRTQALTDWHWAPVSMRPETEASQATAS